MYDIPDITPLERAIQRLEEGLERYRKDTSDLQIRDGLMTFQGQIRTANEQGLLLGAWPEWRDYRKMRGMPSHTYSEPVAISVVAAIPGFLEEAAYLRDRLRD
ncbi:MAG: nucleotidyltransferase substrate binding protein [Gemmatimonadetes bacterium]|nr:nucleotidyltransferase substrate binding protein [Gemmatimonadota bacterium]